MFSVDLVCSWRFRYALLAVVYIFFGCGVWLGVLVGSFNVVCGVVQYYVWQKVCCFLGGI